MKRNFTCGSLRYASHCLQGNSVLVLVTTLSIIEYLCVFVGISKLHLMFCVPSFYHTACYLLFYVYFVKSIQCDAYIHTYIPMLFVFLLILISLHMYMCDFMCLCLPSHVFYLSQLTSRFFSNLYKLDFLSLCFEAFR